MLGLEDSCQLCDLEQITSPLGVFISRQKAESKAFLAYLTLSSKMK